MKVIQYIKINHLFNRVAFASGVILTLLATVLCLPINSGEQEAQAATGTAQESSITMNFASNTASVDLAVSSSDGTFATSSESNKAAFSIATNNYTGYTLSISASDDAGTLANGNDSLTSITTNKTLTDTTFDNSDYNGMWGYKPSKYMNGNTVVDNTGTNAVYLISPTTTATTLHVTSAANSTANSYNIALGARADYTKPSGTYSKTFILTAVANKINYSVTYNKNTTDTVTNMPYSNTGNVQSGDTNSTSITLSDLVPAREHYSFLGWCSVTPTTSDGVDSCSGTIYNPNGDGTNRSYGIDQTTLNNGTIYAMWKIDTFTCTKQYKLQNADGTYPDAYTADGSETIDYGSNCTYSKTITDYQGNSGNDTARSTSQTITGATTLSLDFPRNTYALTVNRNTSYISSVTGAGTYRWGQTVSVSANTSHVFSGWSISSGSAGTFANSGSASTTYTMPKGASTIYANGRYYYIQDFTRSLCSSKASNGNWTVIDRRDSKTYTVRYINGRCWMTQNLRIVGTISSTYSNFSRVSSFNVSQYDLANKTYCGFATSSSDIRGFINVCSHDSGNATNGAWYNYAAATAGQIVGGENSTASTQDICPQNWHLPSGPGTTSGTDFNSLAGNTTAGWQTGTSTSAAFSGVGGDAYIDGSICTVSGSEHCYNGYYWSSSPQNVYVRYAFAYGSGDGWFRSDYQEQRAVGQYVRCVRSS